MLTIKYESNDGMKVLTLNNNLKFFKKIGTRRKRFFFKEAKGLSKFYGYKNFRFKIKFIKNYGIRILINLPFLYWEVDNNNWYFGTPNCYLWGLKKRNNMLFRMRGR